MPGISRAAFFALTGILGCATLRADFIMIAQPTTAYINGTRLLDFTDPDTTYVDSISGGGETLTYDSALDIRTVPTSWLYWNNPPAVETATPRVGWTDPGFPELTITLSVPATTFGFELGPDLYQAEETTADFYSGSKLVGTIDLFPNGNNGALLFAASTTTDPFTRVVINNLEGDDFAIARQRFALATTAVPEPSTLLLFGLPMAVLLAAKASRRRANL